MANTDKNKPHQGNQPNQDNQTDLTNGRAGIKTPQNSREAANFGNPVKTPQNSREAANFGDPVKSAPTGDDNQGDPNAEANGGEPVRHSLDDIRARMRQRHADKNFDNDDDLYDGIYSDMDDDDVRRDDLALLQKREAEFNDAMKYNPNAGDFFVAVSEGKSPVAMLLEAMGTDAVKDYLNSEDNAKELAEAQQKYLDEVKKGETFRQQYEDNVKESLKADDKAVKDGILTEDDIDRAHEALEKKVNNYILGIKESIEGEAANSGSTTFVMWNSEAAPATTSGTASSVYYLMQDCAGISESAKLGELWYYDGTSWKEYSGELLG